MKNLKKVLALGLALVMVLGMFTIASAAETKTAQDFTDWADVEHKDAVALCVDLGIISGKPDGSFAPNDPIDRASWAKLVYFTATGDDNADAYLGTITDLVDTKGSWAESYINYIYANQYVSGDGQGHFMPTSNITVAGGLKTMLTVLGYDANDRGYQNTSAWMGNIMTDAKRNGLMDDIDRSQTAAVNLTRDNAAQIVYNALQANIVEAVPQWDAGNKYITTYNKGATLGYDVFRAIPVTAVVDAVDADGIASFKAGSTNPAKITATDLKDVKASSTLVGETVTVWVKAKGASFSYQTGEMDTTSLSFDEVISAAAAKAASSAAETFTDGLTLAGIYTPEKDASGNANAGYDKDHFVAEADGTPTVYVNGKTDTTTSKTNRGDVVEVYTANGKVTMIKVTTWTAATLSDDAETRTSGDKLQVRLPGVSGLTGWKDADKVDGYQGLAKDDVVLVNVDTNGFYTIEKAEKVTGKVTSSRGTSDVKLTMGGKQYQATDKTAFDSWDVKKNADNEYDFYLDKNGTVCKSVLVEGEVKTEVAYVIEAVYVTGSGIKGSYYGEAELLFADGTTEIVRVAKYNEKDVDKDIEDADKTAFDALDGEFVDYSVNNDGNYELSAKRSGNKIADKDNTVQIEGKIDFDGNSTVATANAKTVFIVKKGDNYEVFTGFAKLPSMKAYGAYTTEVDKSGNPTGAATYVYLVTDSYEGDAPTGWIYIADKDAFDTDANNLKVYEIYDVDGNKTTMPIQTTISDAGFYEVTKVDEKNGNTVTLKTVTTELKALADGVLDIDGTKYAYDSETVGVVVDFDTKGEFVSVSTFSPNSFTIEDAASYTYKAVQAGADKAGDTVDFIYVYRTETPAPTTPSTGG